MSRLLLICVETDNNASTDEAYIQKVIETFYDNPEQISIKYPKMKGCSNLTKLQKHIAEVRRDFIGISKTNCIDVICCFDTDKYDADKFAAQKLKCEEDFCSSNGYDFVWFCRDIEEVFWNKTAAKSEKKQLAKQFLTSKQIDNVGLSNLQAKTYSRSRSNLVDKLDQYLKRKEL